MAVCLIFQFLNKAVQNYSETMGKYHYGQITEMISGFLTCIFRLTL